MRSVKVIVRLDFSEDHVMSAQTRAFHCRDAGDGWSGNSARFEEAFHLPLQLI